VGISLFMGGESTPSRAVVHSAGEGYRLKASVLIREFALGGPLQHLACRSVGKTAISGAKIL
jgi:hypothetical protein